MTLRTSRPRATAGCDASLAFRGKGERSRPQVSNVSVFVDFVVSFDGINASESASENFLKILDGSDRILDGSDRILVRMQVYTDPHRSTP